MLPRRTRGPAPPPPSQCENIRESGRMATEKAAEVVTRKRPLGTHGALGLVAGVSEPPHVWGAWRAVGLAPVLVALGHKHVVQREADHIRDVAKCEGQRVLDVVPTSPTPPMWHTYLANALTRCPSEVLWRHDVRALRRAVEAHHAPSAGLEVAPQAS